MVLVQGPPSPQRAELRVRVERAVREVVREAAGAKPSEVAHLTVMDHRALGEPRSRIDTSTRRRALAMGVEYLLVVSIEANERAKLSLEDLAAWSHKRADSSASGSQPKAVTVSLELDAALDEKLVSCIGRLPRSREGDRTLDSSGRHLSRRILRVQRPELWSARHGRGPDLRPVLRDTMRGRWIAYDEAYALVGRDDWQAQYDRKMRVRLGLIAAGSVGIVGGLASTFGVATVSPESDNAATSHQVVLPIALGGFALGTAMVVGGYFLNPHPVDVKTFRRSVDALGGPRLELKLSADSRGGSAGIRAAF